MHAPGRKPVIAFADLPGKAYTHVSYSVTPATAAAELGGGATDADKQLMVQNGYSVYVEGSATKDATTSCSTWGFKTSTLYDKCKGEVSGKETEGVVVTNGGNDAVELTNRRRPPLLRRPPVGGGEERRVDNIANADADNDGEVIWRSSPRSSSPTRRRSPPAPTARAAPPTSTTSARSSRRSRARSATSAAKGSASRGRSEPGAARTPRADALRRAQGNQSEAARLLRTSRATLQYKMKTLPSLTVASADNPAPTREVSAGERSGEALDFKGRAVAPTMQRRPRDEDGLHRGRARARRA